MLWHWHANKGWISEMSLSALSIFVVLFFGRWLLYVKMFCIDAVQCFVIIISLISSFSRIMNYKEQYSHPLTVLTSTNVTKPPSLSPLCGWQKEETSSPKKISPITPTKRRTKVNLIPHIIINNHTLLYCTSSPMAGCDWCSSIVDYSSISITDKCRILFSW